MSRGRRPVSAYTEEAMMPEETREERLAREVQETDQLNGRLAHLLGQSADALKGDPGPNRLHDWSDLPAVATKMRRALKLIVQMNELDVASSREYGQIARSALGERVSS